MLRLPQLIGLAGYARSGKDTTARLLNNAWGYERVSFADGVREFALHLNPYVAFPATEKVRLQQLVAELGWEDAKEIAEVRTLLQKVGGGVREFFGADVWVDRAFSKIKPGGLYVVTDVRYMNEAQRIVDSGGKIFRVERPDTGPVNEFEAKHHGLNDWPYDGAICNDGTIVDLIRQISTVFGTIS